MWALDGKIIAEDYSRVIAEAASHFVVGVALRLMSEPHYHRSQMTDPNTEKFRLPTLFAPGKRRVGTSTRSHWRRQCLQKGPQRRGLLVRCKTVAVQLTSQAKARYGRPGQLMSTAPRETPPLWLRQ